jgi:hypothetical protein
VIRPVGPDIDQHVRWLDVAVDEAGGVRGVQGRGHREDDRANPGDGHGTVPADQGPDVPAGHVAHRDEQHSVGLARLVNRNDVRVIDGRGRAGLPDEALPERPVRGQGRRQQLQRHAPPQALVHGAEDHRHPARPDLLLQPVSGHPRAWRETARHGGQRPARIPPKVIIHSPPIWHGPAPDCAALG